MDHELQSRCNDIDVENKKLRADLVRMREVLKFYGEVDNYRIGVRGSVVGQDCGWLARETLETTK
jgi:hypothetical protein